MIALCELRLGVAVGCGEAEQTWARRGSGPIVLTRRARRDQPAKIPGLDSGLGQDIFFFTVSGAGLDLFGDTGRAHVASCWTRVELSGR